MAELGTSKSTQGGLPFKIVRGTRTYKCADYSVAWICALRDTELLAARVLLDEEHNPPSYDTQYDRNTYKCGKIGEHKVVVACLPSGRSGNVNAGHLTGPMFHTFPNIKITLLVGIGGGVPLKSPQNPLEDVYLGDVVIGWPGDGTPAVVQHDSGRWKADGFEKRGSVEYAKFFFVYLIYRRALGSNMLLILDPNSQPEWHLTQALDIVVSDHEVGQTDFQKSLDLLQKLPKFASRRSDEDRLFKATYKHEGDYYSQCSHCLPENLVKRPERAEARPDGSFKFHHGTIASGGAVIQDGELRDRVSRECNDARCFEMEAVGVNLNSRCLVIRGLADYADSHKNDVWKYVAAGNAAVFAKEFLLTIKASGLRELSGIVAVQTPISTLPGTLSIDPDFVGRDDVIKQMDEQFTKSNRVALVGLGGIGKTEIAVQYAHKYRQRTPECHIFWVYGATRQSFDEAYRRIAKELKIPGCDDPQFEHRKVVPRELDRQQTGPWIMIVDNADNYSIYFPPQDGALGESEQSEYLGCCLPYGAENRGRLIVTTRNAKLGENIMDGSETVQVSELAPVDAKKLLRSKIPAQKWEDEAADMLLRELDYIPLAVTQAAAFVKRNKLTSLKFYLGKLCQFHLNVRDVLSKELHDGRRQPGTPNAIFRTWQISYQQIQLDNTEAANKLSLMAVLDSQAIPRMLLAKKDTLEMVEMEAIQVLLDFSLIRGDEQYQYFSMHPLQQLSTQNWLRFDSSRLEEWQDNGLVLLSERMPRCTIDEKEKRHTCSVLLPHATIVVSYDSKNLECRSLLLRNMSIYEGEMGRYQVSYQHAVQSYEESLEAHGEASQRHTWYCKFQLSAALIQLKRITEAAKLLDEAENETEVVREQIESSVAYISAVELKNRGQENMAFAAFQRAMDLCQVRSDRRLALVCLNQQAGLAKRLGKVDESESLHRQALQEAIDVYGERHSEVFTYMSHVASSVQEQGRTAEAVRLHRLVLRGMEELYGMEHPLTIESILELALALESEGNLVEAAVLCRRVLECCQRDPEMDLLGAPFLINLIIDLKRDGNLVEATVLGRQILKCSPGNLEQLDRSDTELLTSLAFALEEEGNLVEAADLGRQLLEYSQRNHELNHTDTVDAATNLFTVLTELGRWEEAVEVSHMVILNPKDDTSVDPSQSELVQKLCCDESENLQELIQEQNEVGYPGNILILEDSAQRLEEREKWGTAEGFWRRILVLDERHRGKEYTETTAYSLKLAMNLYEQEKYQAALQVIKEVIENMKRHYAEETAKIREYEKYYEDLNSWIMDKHSNPCATSGVSSDSEEGHHRSEPSQNNSQASDHGSDRSLFKRSMEDSKSRDGVSSDSEEGHHRSRPSQNNSQTSDHGSSKSLLRHSMEDSEASDDEEQPTTDRSAKSLAETDDPEPVLLSEAMACQSVAGKRKRSDDGDDDA